MQINPKQIAVSNDKAAGSLLAERLLSPAIAQLDARAFSAKRLPSNRNSPLVLAVGVAGFLIAAMVLTNWLYLPVIEPVMQLQSRSIKSASPLIPAKLEVSEVRLRKISINRKKIALVGGQIINRSGDKLPIPQLNIVLRGKDGQNFVSWRYRPQQTSLKAGASLRFTSKFSTDVKDGSVIEIQFVPRDDR